MNIIKNAAADILGGGETAMEIIKKGEAASARKSAKSFQNMVNTKEALIKLRF